MVRQIGIVAFALAGACGHSAPPETAPEVITDPAGAGRSEQLITEKEIQDSQSITAYDVVKKLRGNFLSDRGKTSFRTTTPSVPSVYLDGQPYGDAGSLKNISAKDVASIRLYRAWEASMKFGATNVAGVIEVTTRRE